MSESAQVTINGAIFSRYECQVSCAIKLWIKDSNNATPSDDNLGYIVKFLRGTDDETVLPCQNIVAQIRRHSEEGVRSIYESVYVNKSHWEREANHERSLELGERIQPSSPQSNELRIFEAYNRTALPLLVEASLRAAVNARMEPIEEQLRALLVDIVRNCQSTVAQNFELMNRPSEGTRALAQHPSQETYVAHTAGSESRERAGSSGAGTRSPGPNFFVEPPHLDEEIVASLPATSHRAENKGENLAQAWGRLPKL
ncbi:MAG: hypothetical protein Q9161_005803 [Pseudevernia consocians]